ncbi:MAG: FecR domain-containing protein [Anaerolineae bacterium]|nr:FecR domain-containing protein [Anaerolineae bacterium]
MNTRCASLLVGLILLLTPGLTSPSTLTGYPAAPALALDDEPLASLDPVQGLIQVQAYADDPADMASWQTVTERLLIGLGDRIRTDGAGLAYLTFFEGVEVEIGPNTLVIVSTLELPTEDNDTVNVTLDMLVGSALSTVDMVLDPEDRFEIHTPGATAVVRGTCWWTVVAPDGSATFNTEDGIVGIISHEPVIVIAAVPEPGEEPGVGEEAVRVVDMGMALEPGIVMRADREGIMEEMGEPFKVPARPRLAALAQPDCGDGICRPRERFTCRVDCLDTVEMPACGDGVCDLAAGEDLLLCPSDCAPHLSDWCGDGICDYNECFITCPLDCELGTYFMPAKPELCCNGFCDPTESALSCPDDCYSGTP